MKAKQRILSLAVIFGIILFSVNAFGAVAGDVDGSGTTDIKDAVVALQIGAGFKPPVSRDADVNGDGKIGLEEAVYALQYATGLILPPLVLPTKTFEESSLNFSFQDETGNVRFLKAEPGYAIAQPVTLSPSATSEDAARSFLSFYGSAFGIENQSAELSVIKTETASQGRNFVRFQQKYNNIPILGGELIVQMDSAKNVMSVNAEILGNADVSALSIYRTDRMRQRIIRKISVRTEPSVSGETARQTALAKIAETYSRNISELTATDPELMIYNPLLLGFSEPDKNMIVWHIEINPLDFALFSEFVLVDADSGEIVLNFNQIDSLKNRLTYNAQNGSKLPGVLCRIEGQGNSADSDCNKAHDYAGDTYDFYSREHGRDSIDNAGMKMISTVHYDSDYCNAFWNGFQMTYGDGCGIVVDDVVAHEMSHGVTQYESDLIYLNQSGAINESFSDIWGEFVDQTNGKGTDSAEVKWKIGEDITGLGAIRDMKDPALFNDPDRITSSSYYCGSGDRGGVHTNSGVGNKAAYLITDGGTFNGYTVRGFGYAKVADLFYEVQTKLLTSAASYADLYDALILSCSNLGYSSDDCQQVQNALKAVEMNLKPCQPQQCTYSISSTSQSFNSDGGIGNVSVTAQNACSWTAVSNTAWITVTSDSSDNGNGTVSYSVASNSGTSSRTGTLTIAGKTFTVTQSGIICDYSISSSSQSFNSDGGTGIVNVTAQSGCSWTATGNVNWITVTSGSSGSGNGTVNYSVASYSGTDSRTGSISIAVKTFTITQSGEDRDAPVANAGDDKTVTEGDKVTLNGSASDSDGYIVSYEWEKISGPGLTLSNTASANFTFTAPQVDSAGATLMFKLTVKDDDGLTGTDTCNVYVKNKNDSDTFTNSLGMTFNLIPAGTFIMGSPPDELGRYSDETQHQVTLTQTFYMQRTEVTQWQWKTVMESNPSWFQSCGDNCPVEAVSWDDIQGFITKMNQRGEGTYRLPTEAEWEYSARAGSTTAFYNGGITVTDSSCGNDPNLSAIGWYCGNFGSTIHPAAQKQANAWGLYDMSGNVWEWCSDWYEAYPRWAVTNPTGSSSGSYRVIRGGGDHYYAQYCRSAERNNSLPGRRYNNIGVRLVRTP